MAFLPFFFAFSDFSLAVRVYACAQNRKILLKICSRAYRKTRRGEDHSVTPIIANAICAPKRKPYAKILRSLLSDSSS